MFASTASLNRAIVLGALLALLAVVTARPEMLVLASPLLLYAAWGWLVRPTREVTMRPRRPPLLLREGGAATIDADLDVVTPLVVVDWARSTVGPMLPPHGTVAAFCSSPGPTIAVEPQSWGRDQVGPPQVVQTDSLGAWRHVGWAAPLTVTVQPPSSVMMGASGVAEPIGIAGAHLSRRTGEGMSLAAIREFSPGDRLRQVNWRVTSRTGSLHVNQTLTERDTDVVVVLDTLENIVGTDGTSSLDIEAAAAIAIGRYYLDEGDRVCFHDLGGAFPTLQPGTGHKQALRMTEAFAQIQRERRRTQAARPVPPVRGGALAFVISPLTSAQTVREALDLHTRGLHVVVVDCFPPERRATARPNPFSARLTKTREAVPMALHLQRLRREPSVDRLTAAGIPVATWSGPASLAGILAELNHRAAAPKEVRR